MKLQRGIVCLIYKFNIILFMWMTAFAVRDIIKHSFQLREQIWLDLQRSRLFYS